MPFISNGESGASVRAKLNVMPSALVYNVRIYGAVGDGSTDDTAAFNSAIADCFNAGGGVVFVPSGHYIVKGAFNGTTNSILTFPQDITYPYFFNRKMVLLGEVRGSFEDDGTTYEGGTVIDCTGHAAASGTFPALIAAAPYIQMPGDVVNSFNNIDLTIDQILFRTPANPTVCGIQFSNGMRLSIGDSVHAVATSAGATVTEPTHANIVGIFFPQTQNNVMVNCGSAMILGFYDGIRGAEHLRFNRPWIGYCVNGVKLLQGWHMVSGQISIEHCNNYLAVDGDAEQLIVNFSLECESVRNAEWYSLEKAIVDSNNVMRGDVRYQIADFTSSGIFLDFAGNSLLTGASLVNTFNLATSDGSGGYGATSGITLVFDSFTGTNGTTLDGRTPSPTNSPGNNWDILSGTWEIQSNKLEQSDHTSAQLVAVVDAENANVSASVVVTLSGTGYSAGIVLRATDNDNYWLGLVSSGGDAFLYKNVANSFTLVDDSSGNSWGATAVVKLKADGNNFTLYVDGVALCTGTDAFQNTATLHGLSQFGGVADDQIFEDFEIDTP